MIQNGAEINATDNEGRTALDVAKGKRANSAIRELKDKQEQIQASQILFNLNQNILANSNSKRK